MLSDLDATLLLCIHGFPIHYIQKFFDQKAIPFHVLIGLCNLSYCLIRMVLFIAKLARVLQLAGSSVEKLVARGLVISHYDLLIVLL